MISYKTVVKKISFNFHFINGITTCIKSLSLLESGYTIEDVIKIIRISCSQLYKIRKKLLNRNLIPYLVL